MALLYNIILIVHIIVVLCLIAVILIQRGRSGGLIEALGGVESIFGTKTSSFFVKMTVVLAILFFMTTITLAYLSKERGKSLLERYKEEAVTITPEQLGLKDEKVEGTQKDTAPKSPVATGSQENMSSPTTETPETKGNATN